MLRRARTQLELGRSTEDELIEPIEAELQEILDQYVDAFERADINTLVGLLRADVELEMPPIPTWFTGRDAVAGFLASRVLQNHGLWRLAPTRANGQAALATWGRQEDGRYVAHGVHMLTFIGDQIARITVFNDPDLVPRFGLARP